MRACCKAFHFRTRPGPAVGEAGGGRRGNVSPVCRDSVSAVSWWERGHSECPSSTTRSLAPTFRSMWPGPTIPTAWMGKQSWGLLRVTQAEGAELTLEPAPLIKSPCFQHPPALEGRKEAAYRTETSPADIQGTPQSWGPESCGGVSC